MALGFFESSSDPSQPDGYDALQRRRKLADALMQQGMSGEPIKHWSQGLANVLKTAIGGYQSSKLDQEEGKQRSEWNKYLAGVIQGGGVADLPGGAPMGEQPPVPGSAPQPGGSPPSIGKIGQGGVGSFDSSMARTFQFEGGLNPRDTNGTPSNFGINAKANPDVDVPNLTQDKAKQLYKQRYWDAIGGDNLPPAVAHVAFDTAVIAGPGKAQELLRASGGDPMKMLDLRDQFQNRLLQSDPAKYGKYAKAWSNRTAGLRADIQAAQPQGQPTQVASANPQMAFAPQPPRPGAMTNVPDSAVVPPGAMPASPPPADMPPQEIEARRAQIAAQGGGRQQLAQTLAQPPAAPARPQMAQPDPSRALLMQALTNPSLSPQQRQQAMSVAQMLQKDDSISTVDLGNAIGIMDKKGNLVRQIPKDKPPTQVDLGNEIGFVDGQGNITKRIPKQKDKKFGVIGQDAFGANSYGFIDEAGGSVTPAQAQGGGQPASPPPTIRTMDGRDIPVMPGMDAKAVREQVSKQGASDMMGAPAALRKVQESITLIDQTLDHPGKKWGVGVAGVVPGIPGTDQRGFVAMHDQLKGRAFLEAFESLKGAGQITEMEGKKATDAVARLDRAQSPKDYDKALTELKVVLQGAAERIYKLPGMKPPEAPQEQAPKRRKFNPATGAIE